MKEIVKQQQVEWPITKFSAYYGTYKNYGIDDKEYDVFNFATKVKKESYR